MACCKDSPPPLEISVRPPTSLPQAVYTDRRSVMQRRAREAMCATCPFAAACRFGGETPEARLARAQPSEVCWAGRWPDPDGIIRVDGIATVGPPKAVRLRLWARATVAAWKRHMAEDGLYPGCGCFVGLLRLRETLLAPAPSDGALRAACGSARNRLRTGWDRVCRGIAYDGSHCRRRR
jgi:hypothetical protein